MRFKTPRHIYNLVHTLLKSKQCICGVSNIHNTNNNIDIDTDIDTDQNPVLVSSVYIGS